MADNSDVLKGIKRRPGVIYSALTPNIKGFHDAVTSASNILYSNKFDIVESWLTL